MAILADPESKAAIKMLVIGIFIGLIAGQLAWDKPAKEPVFVEPVGERVIYVIQQWGKSAFIFTRYKDLGQFEFETEMRPDSPYYPRPETIMMGQKAWPFNPKFNEWVKKVENQNK